MSQFAPYDKTTHDARLEAIKAKSKRGYLDDGPVAIYHILKETQAKGFHDIVEWALIEIERLYKVEGK
jgi:hypothetical protein